MNKKKILIINTGGTISSVKSPHGFAPLLGHLSATLPKLMALQHPEMPQYDILELKISRDALITYYINLENEKKEARKNERLEILEQYPDFSPEFVDLANMPEEVFKNMVAGLDLIRKVEGGSGHVLTIPLITKSDGAKFGKSASGSVWLDPEMTSPYAFYQFWIGIEDADVEKLLKVFSFKSHAEIDQLLESLRTNPGLREAHRALAKEITALVHGEEEAAQAEAAAKALFGQGELSELSEKTLESALSQLPRVEIKSGEPIPTWIDLLAATGVVDSKSAARRIVKEGGAYLNNEKISGEDFIPPLKEAIYGRFFILRKGKRDLAAVEIKS